MDTSFVPLRLRSRHSRLAGTMLAREIPSHLKRMGFKAGALIDAGNLYGAIEFYEGCREEGIRPIIGAELECPETGHRASLVALSRAGYANLCRIISEINLSKAASLVESIERSPEGIAALCLDVDYALAVAQVLGRDRVWLEIVANRMPAPRFRDLLTRARGRALRSLASWEVLFMDPADEKISRLLTSIREAKLLSQVTLRARDASLMGCSSLRRLLAGNPELLRETRELADMVDLTLDIGRPHFPRARPTRQESLTCLEAMCREALTAKYDGRSARAERRLQAELRVIRKLGLADYFLVVRDIVAFAEANSIPAAGRGSGVGSLVAYLLDITQVDPISHGLLFERFLNEHRPDYPDLDIDFSWKRRDEVIDYAYTHFGTSRVAMISTHTCFELRSAARETAKAFGLTPAEAQSLSSRLPWRGAKGKATVVERAIGEVKPELPSRSRRAIGELAASVVGFPHHSSVHCGGVVISDRPITYYTPLEVAAKGIQVTQFDMHAIEKIGLVKIDLLGNRALTVIEEATRDITTRRGHPPRIDHDDPATTRLLKRGRTLSCFQLESPAMRNLLAMLGAADRNDAILAVALVRPGPSAGGMKDKFLRTRCRARDVSGAVSTGGQPARAELPVYEEDVMRIISEVTGMTLAEADLLRRQLKQTDINEDDLGEKFVFLAETAGTRREQAHKAWQQVRRFAAYTYCKAHAAAFGTISYATAYLKANFPLEFYAATLRNHAGMYPTWVHINEARRVGVEVLLPAVNRSEPDFSIEGEAIRSGLKAIKHLSQTTIEEIVRARASTPFRSLSDFLARVPTTRDEVASMVGCGAFDEIEEDRCGALAGYLSLKGNLPRYGQPPLDLADGVCGLPTRPFSRLQERGMEYATLGFSPRVHPLEFFTLPAQIEAADPSRPSAGRAAGRSLRRWPASRACRSRPRHAGSAVGLLAATRHYEANGTDIYFLTLDNPQGLRECIVSRRLLSRRLEIGKGYHVTGGLTSRFGVETLRVTSIAALPEKLI